MRPSSDRRSKSGRSRYRSIRARSGRRASSASMRIDARRPVTSSVMRRTVFGLAAVSAIGASAGTMGQAVGPIIAGWLSRADPYGLGCGYAPAQNAMPTRPGPVWAPTTRRQLADVELRAVELVPQGLASEVSRP